MTALSKKICRSSIALALALAYGLERPSRVPKSSIAKKEISHLGQNRPEQDDSMRSFQRSSKEAAVTESEGVVETPFIDGYAAFQQLQFPDDDGRYREGELPSGPDGIVEGIEGAEPDA